MSSVLLDISFLVNCHISIVSFFVFFVLYKIEIKFSLSFLLVLSSSDQNLTGSDQILWGIVKYCILGISFVFRWPQTIKIANQWSYLIHGRWHAWVAHIEGEFPVVILPECL